MKIGFVGLGTMGQPMVKNLSKQFEVHAFDNAQKTIEDIQKNNEANSLTLLDSIEELKDIDVLILMLPNGRIVRDCILGTHSTAGALNGLSKDAIVIDMSSSSPLDTLNLDEELKKSGITLLDAPVSGSVQKAINGTLSIMVGGDASAIEKVNPILKTMGSVIIPTGKTGSAHGMKALNNYVYAAGLFAVSEALLMAKKLELDLEKFTDILNASSGRNVASETKIKQHMLKNGDFKGGFGLHLMAKDLGISYGLTEKLDFTPSLLNLCFHTWQEATKNFPPDADNLEIYHHLQNEYQA
ncbi:NAD(P)-dependent oxidoreductase [Advenella sp. WQ 585]|uniref:NAD(P)-dependent oxidoreductase n=1 Tax=Advenella mandrilli TaxID=2800330 RepID=A0ABS1EH82_9BURK|nr:NAD(P)-dependent oxidoreductase [Advenella mandrilli]MBK1782388.1 NAD(P)-dependent oxidoreductase [Advenella mandrilli]